MFGSSAGRRPRGRAPVAAPVEPQSSRATAAGTASRKRAARARRSSPRALPPAQERSQRPQPVAVGRERDVAHAGRGERGDQRAALVAAAAANRSRSRRSPVSTRSCRPVSGSTRRSSPTSASSCSRGSRTSTASTAWRPASRRSGAPPVGRAAKVRDDDDQRALLRDPVGELERFAQRACARRRQLAQQPQRVEQRAAALARPLDRRARLRTRPCRAGCRAVSRHSPTATATPSATSALRRSPVPNAIDADASSTSHVTSTRSASSTRTCGSPVRAVTFHSIRRTSSPGS